MFALVIIRGYCKEQMTESHSSFIFRVAIDIRCAYMYIILLLAHLIKSLYVCIYICMYICVMFRSQ